jgi:CubicO group peptidase (beta-lactamase class C family)
MSLVDDGSLSRSTTARSVLGENLPLIDEAVTVEQLLAHRSGIRDYFGEEVERPITDYVYRRRKSRYATPPSGIGSQYDHRR